VVGYESLYEVSDCNRVKALHKTIQRKDGIECVLGERLVRVHNTSDGYLKVRISKNNKGQTLLLHRLIAMSAIPNNGNYNEVNHKDGNKINNKVENLEWVSHKQNMIHANENKLMNFLKGKDCYCAKLSDTDVLSILNSTDKYPVISKKFNVTVPTICSIKRGRSWTHVTGFKKIKRNGFNAQ
jgi:hypothetical protein